MSDARVLIDLSTKEQRLYERLRARVVEKEPGGRSGVRDLLLLLPDLTVLLVRLSRDARIPPGGKAIALLGVAYVVSPLDLLPDLLLGPLGLIDDLLVLAAALSRLLNYAHPDVVSSHWPGRGDALEAIQRLTQWAETFVTTRLPKAVLRLAGRV